MKKIVLTCYALVIFFIQQLNAQCNVSNLAIQLQSATIQNGQCQVLFNFSWTQDVNNGNKFAVIHFWRSDQYPALELNGLAYVPTSNRPMSNDLVDALATIVILNNGDPVPTIGTVYHPDPTVSVLSTGLTVHKENTATNGVYRMTVKNIALTIPNCLGVGLTGDIWASQQAHGDNVHCVKSNVSVIIGNPRVTGLMICPLPRQYSTQITNVGPDPIDVSYNIYIDEGDAVFEPTVHDLKITSTPVGPYNLTSGQTYNSGPQGYPPYSSTLPYANFGLWIEVIIVGFPNTSLYFISNTCIGLPVHFGTFIAKREKAIVKLNWETLTEADNRGFEIERKIGNGSYEVIAFVSTKAIDGNSQDKLSYEYDDNNPSTLISLYRIRQIDINNGSSYSEYRAVAGLGKNNILQVYPNPVRNGRVNIIYADPTKTYDLSLFDQHGRAIAEWRNYNRQYIYLGTIQPGIYTLRVVEPGLKLASIIKLVVAVN